MGLRHLPLAFAGSALFRRKARARTVPSPGWRLSLALALVGPGLLFFSLFQWVLPNYSMNSSGRCSNWFTTAGEN